VRQRGEVDETNLKETETATATYEKASANCRVLAEALNLEMPVMPPEPVEEARFAGEITLGGRGGDDMEEDWGSNVFEDHDTRQFYQALPDLFEMVPAVLLGEEAMARRANALALAAELEAEAAAEGEQGKAGEDEEEGAKTQEQDGVNAETKKAAQDEAAALLQAKEEEEAEAAEKRAAAQEADTAGGGQKTENEDEDDPNAVEKAKFDEFVANLYKCQSRDLIDKAAQNFCYMNNKLNRRKLARALFQVPRGNLALLQYLARFVAVLDVAMDDIAPMLADLLHAEFRSFTRHRQEGQMETKQRNIRFQAELVKFKLIKPFAIFKCLQTFMDDFAFQNIDLACSILEVCGRFLYRTQATHERTVNLINAMLRIKQHKNLDARYNTMIENAYYVCRPPEQKARAKRKERPPVHDYIRHLIFTKLNKTNLDFVKKQLRKLDWPLHETYVVKSILKVQKIKYNQVYLLASLTSGLVRYHSTLPIHLTDDLLSEVRQLLHANEFAKQQRLLGLVKLLGELYNDLVVDSPIIFDMLYTFISTGNERVGAMPDAPSDFLRVRLVCTLLDTCGHYFDRGSTKKKLDTFIAHFQRYLFGKESMPMEMDFAVSDMLDLINPSFQRADTCEAADAFVALAEGEHKGSKARGLAALQVHKQGLNVGEESDDDDDDNRASRDQRVGSDDEGASGGGRGADDADARLLSEEAADSFDYRDEHVEEDEAVVVHWKPKAAEPSADDDLFDAEFQKMLIDNRGATGARRTQLEVEIPLALQAESDNSVPKLVERGGETKVMFKLLTKKNHKATTKEIEVPLETTIAHASFDRSNAEAHEKDEVKRKVLGYQAQVDGGTLLNQYQQAYRGGFRGRGGYSRS